MPTNDRIRRKAVWSGIVLFLALFGLIRPASATPAPCADETTTIVPAGFSALRTDMPFVRQLLDEGVAHSPTFASFVDRLAVTDIIVFVEPSLKLPNGISAYTAFAAKTPKCRYLQVLFDPRLPRLQMIALIGHELQHVLEVAAHPEVVDPTSLAAVYSEIGRSGPPLYGRHAFDSELAIAAGHTIFRELVEPAAAAATAVAADDGR